MWLTDLDRFKAACVYPGKLDEQAVERELAAYLQALAMRRERRIERLRAESRPAHDPPPNRNIAWISVEGIKRKLDVLAFPALRAAQRLRATLAANADVAFDAHSAALAARAASDAGAAAFGAFEHRSAQAFAAFHRSAQAFAAFNLHSKADLRMYWPGSMWEISSTACALLERNCWPESQLRELSSMACGRFFDPAWGNDLAKPLFEAFVCGCWLLYWADNYTLYWVAKPTVHREPGTQRLHHDTQPALESDILNLYFWHGVMVPPFVIRRPDRITIADIDQETNAEVRRVMIERYRHGEEIHGAAAFIRDAGGERLDHDECYGTLWRRNIRNDEPIVMIEVVNRTRESDGSFKRYWLRVPPNTQTAREGVAWTIQYAGGAVGARKRDLIGRRFWPRPEATREAIRYVAD